MAVSVDCQGVQERAKGKSQGAQKKGEGLPRLRFPPFWALAFPLALRWTPWQSIALR